MASTSARVIGIAAPAAPVAAVPAGAVEEPAAADAPGALLCPKIADAMLLKMPIITS
jgi:hypothetical protein